MQGEGLLVMNSDLVDHLEYTGKSIRLTVFCGRGSKRVFLIPIKSVDYSESDACAV